MIKKVVVPTDLSACAKVALVQGIAIARMNGAELHLVEVLPNYQGTPYVTLQTGDWQRFFAEQSNRASELLYELLQSVDHEGVEIVEHLPLASAVAPAVVDVAKEVEADLVVMGAHGQRGFRRFLLGSVAQEVVRLASCPVMTVREEAKTFLGPPSRLVVPVDLSQHSKLALIAAQKWADEDSLIEMVHVLERRKALFEDDPGDLNEAGTDELYRRAEAAIQRFAESALDPRLTNRIKILEGRPSEAIADYAEASGTDLIVISTHGLSGLPHLLLGSVAERLLRLSQCPVLTLKSLTGD